MLIAVMFYTSSLVIIKVINEIEPGISGSVLLTMRAASVCLILTIYTLKDAGV